MAKPLILVTNDDGITAPGLKGIDYDLCGNWRPRYSLSYSSPDIRTRSGMGHSDKTI